MQTVGLCGLVACALFWAVTSVMGEGESNAVLITAFGSLTGIGVVTGAVADSKAPPGPPPIARSDTPTETPDP
jgi:hypothetical protein